MGDNDKPDLTLAVPGSQGDPEMLSHGTGLHEVTEVPGSCVATCTLRWHETADGALNIDFDNHGLAVDAFWLVGQLLRIATAMIEEAGDTEDFNAGVAVVGKIAVRRAVLLCPECDGRHVDDGEWSERLHHEYLCDHCGYRFVVDPYTFGVGYDDPEDDDEGEPLPATG